MATPARKVVLITGASSGIGAATASRLVRTGFRVYATARHVEALDELKAQGCETLRLDVTDETSMREAVETIEAREGGIGALINEVYEHGVLAKLGGTPDDVAEVIEHALTESYPKTRYAVTASAHLLMAQHAVISDNLWDHFLATQFPRPGIG